MILMHSLNWTPLVIEFLQLQIWLPELGTSLFLHLLNMSSQYRLVGHSLLPLWTQKQIYLSSPLILSSKWYYLEIQIKYILAYTLSVVCRQHPDINLSARPSVISLRSDLSLYALSISHCRWSHLLLYFTNWGSRKCHWFCFVAFIRQFQNWSCLLEMWILDGARWTRDLTPLEFHKLWETSQVMTLNVKLEKSFDKNALE